jgi:uncharacterized protein YajQ (UPF0234 family)
MPSFDVVSKADLQEIDNAVQSVLREIKQRYDFKGSNATLTRDEQDITLLAEDDYKLSTIQDMLKVHVVRRSLDSRVLDFQKPEAASGQSLRQKVIVRQGIDSDIAKMIVKRIKEEKLKVQVSIRSDELRVEGKKRDDLQDCINFIKSLSLQIPVQFLNFRD